MRSFKEFITEAEDFAPERTKPIQSSLPGLGRKSIDKKYQVTNKPDVPARYSQVDPRQALMNYATELETRGVAGGRRKPEQVKLSPEEIKRRTAQVRDTFAAADKGDAAAVERLKKYQAGYDKKYGVPEVEQSKPNEYIRRQQEAGIKVDDDLVDARGVAQSGKPEMVGQRAPSGQGARFRAAAAARTDIPDAGTATPKPGVRTDSLDDAIRNVPPEPELPKIKVTGGQPRVSDRGTVTNPLSQSELKREIINRRGRKVELPPRPASPRPVTGPSLGSPTASGMTPMRAAQVAAARSATPQGATSVAGRLKSFNDFLKTTSQNTALARGLRVVGRGAQGVSFGMDAAQGYGDAKRRGADNFRATARGLVRGTGSLAGGTVGALGGAFAGTAGGSFTGPGAVVTGALGAYTGGAAGSMVGGELADKAFQTVAGATDAEKQLMRKRKRDSQVDVYGRGPQYTNARGGKAIVKDPTTGKARVGYLSYKDGKPVYTAPNDPSTLRYTSSNPLERVGRTLGQSGIPGLGNWLNTYYSQKDEKARIRDVNRQIQNSTSGRI